MRQQWACGDVAALKWIALRAGVVSSALELPMIEKLGEQLVQVAAPSPTLVNTGSAASDAAP